jgi:hypothetical protein
MAENLVRGSRKLLATALLSTAPLFFPFMANFHWPVDFKLFSFKPARQLWTTLDRDKCLLSCWLWSSPHRLNLIWNSRLIIWCDRKKKKKQKEAPQIPVNFIVGITAECVEWTHKSQSFNLRYGTVLNCVFPCHFLLFCRSPRCFASKLHYKV